MSKDLKVCDLKKRRPGQVCNRRTGRWVSHTSREVAEFGSVFNTDSKRWVKATGRKGRELMKNEGFPFPRKTVAKKVGSPKKKAVSPKKTVGRKPTACSPKVKKACVTSKHCDWTKGAGCAKVGTSPKKRVVKKPVVKKTVSPKASPKRSASPKRTVVTRRTVSPRRLSPRLPVVSPSRSPRVVGVRATR